MAKYNSILTAVWDDKVFNHWSRDGKLLFFNLITTHRQNPIGLYEVEERALKFETDMDDEAFTRAWDEIRTVYNGYARVQYDAERSVVLIINTLKHQPGAETELSVQRNVNLLKCIDAVTRQYADSPLVREFFSVYKGRGFDLKKLLAGLDRSAPAARSTPRARRPRGERPRAPASTPTKPVEITAKAKELGTWFAAHQPYKQLKDPERFAAELLQTYPDKPVEWFQEQGRKLLEWMLRHNIANENIRDLRRMTAHWMKQAYGDPEGRRRVKDIMRRTGKA